MEKAFLDSDGDFDVCINCAAETRYGQSEEVNNATCTVLGFDTLLLLIVNFH